MRLIDADEFESYLINRYGGNDTGDEIIEDLYNQPTVDAVERKKGKWIDVWRSAFDGTRHWDRECSECGYDRDDDSIDKDTRFCPNCGAEMRGEANERTD